MVYVSGRIPHPLDHERAATPSSLRSIRVAILPMWLVNPDRYDANVSSMESAGAKRVFWDGPWRDPGPSPREEISVTPVWVQLEAINVRVPGMPKRVAPEGLDMSGQVRGLLKQWHHTGDGDWLGIVTSPSPTPMAVGTS